MFPCSTYTLPAVAATIATKHWICNLLANVTVLPAALNVLNNNLKFIVVAEAALLNRTHASTAYTPSCWIVTGPVGDTVAGNVPNVVTPVVVSELNVVPPIPYD